jgi:hypothetical protein
MAAITSLVACASVESDENNNDINNNTFPDTTSNVDTGTPLVTPDNGTTPPPTQTPLQQCQAAVSCLQSCIQTNNCQDEACAQGCQTTCSAENADGWSLYMQIETCLQNTCVGITDQNEMALCALAEQASGGACFQQASACGLQGGAGNCNQLTTCIFGCPDGDGACQQQCLVGASKQGINDFSAWNNCLTTTCNQHPEGSAEQNACVQEAQKQGGACFAQTDACGMATGTGAVGCKDTLICLILCPEGDSACQMACTQAASQDGLDLFTAMNDCLDTACAGIPSGSPEQTDCIQNAQAEGQACFQSYVDCGLYGTGTCSGINTCMAVCQDYNCLYNCVFAGSAQGQALFNKWQGCLSDACYQPGQPCDINPQSPECGNCQGTNCQDLKANCDADGGVSPTPSAFMHSFDPNAGSAEDVARVMKNARILLERHHFKFYNPYN